LKYLFYYNLLLIKKQRKQLQAVRNFPEKWKKIRNFLIQENHVTASSCQAKKIRMEGAMG